MSIVYIYWHCELYRGYLSLISQYAWIVSPIYLKINLPSHVLAIISSSTSKEQITHLHATQRPRLLRSQEYTKYHGVEGRYVGVSKAEDNSGIITGFYGILRVQEVFTDLHSHRRSIN
jgi:hypothetical protein